MSLADARAFKPELLTIESTTLADYPCVLQGRPHLGVQAHRIDRLRTYPGRVFRSRLIKPTSGEESEKLTKYLLDRVGTSYDGRGAITAGTMLWKHWFGAMRAADRSSLYCAELVGEAIMRSIDGCPEWRPGKLTPGRLAVLSLRHGIYSAPQQITWEE
jgi:hypothetical protein